jgi:hypothetical protein
MGASPESPVGLLGYSSTSVKIFKMVQDKDTSLLIGVYYWQQAVVPVSFKKHIVWKGSLYG